MAGIFNVGDILMLCQLAWKIGCAFTSGKNSAPVQFIQVENELLSLTSALTLLAETLDEDTSILDRSDQKTREGAVKILESCRQTLSNLDSFVNQYQEIKKSDGDGDGLVPTQKSWKNILIRNYKTIWWTAEGGNIDNLRNMLNMHVNSISVMMQALQSKSLSRLENTIEPMANKVDDIHTTLNGDLNVKVDEIHHLMMSIRAMEQTPRLPPESPESLGKKSASELPYRPKREEVKPVSFNTSREPPRDSSLTYPPYPTEKISVGFDGHDASTGLQLNTDPRPRAESWSSKPESWLVSRDSGRDSNAHETLPEYERYRSPVGNRSNRNSLPSPAEVSPSMYRSDSDASRTYSQGTLQLPPPTLPLESTEKIPVSPPKKEYNPKKDHEKLLSRDSEVSRAIQWKITVTEAEHLAFKKDLFSDSAVLCEAACSKVEYTIPDEENPLDLKMVQGSAECQLFLVTKRHKLSSGILRFTTSIWALSDDKNVRMQQELPDGEEVVPYTVWGSLKKICIRVPTELRFYDRAYDAKPIDIVKTSWVNYLLEDESNSSAFQSALMGKTLVMSLKTNKTMRVHKGLIADTFSYQEQMCALENMRIWQDHETNGFLAMIHYTAHFRDGYLAFYLNSSRDPIRIQDEGSKSVKIKGLRLEVPPKPKYRTNSMDIRRSPSARPNDAKNVQIKGAKIEFTSEEDKKMFIEKVREVQGTFYSG